MLIVGAGAGTLGAALGTAGYSPLIGWDAAAATFSFWVWSTVIGMDATTTRTHARREDPGRAATDVLLLVASVASLIGVGMVLGEANSAHGSTRGLLAVLAITSVVLSWLLVHTTFTLRYARLYYVDDGGVDFNQSEAPTYSDFAYLAFTVGMTFQVSDTDLETHRIRVAVLRHALLSYLFGAVILATTVNFLVGLSSSSH
jgi:uncharacterized membrane protein